MGTHRYRLRDATLHPPALSAADEDAAAKTLPWVLLEVEAYVAKRDNATTAYSQTWDGKQIQVTFCVRRPPRVSYLCVHSPDAEIPLEPEILAMDHDLVLLRIAACAGDEVNSNLDFYVYQADDGSGRPSLTHLPRLPSPYCSFRSEEIGIMRFRTIRHDDDYLQTRTFLRPHRSDDGGGQEYIVAGISMAPDQEREEECRHGTFVFCLYNSKEKIWTTAAVSLNQQQRRELGPGFEHHNSKVIAIGGDAGTMAFVDLWRGILFCDVLPRQGKAIPPLRYIPLPQTLPKNKLRGEAKLARDIAVVNGRFKYVELRLLWKDSVVFPGHRLRDGWVAATYSRPATSSVDDTWCKHYEVNSNLMNLKEDPLSKHLPRAVNDEGMLLPHFKRIFVCQPTLALHDGAGQDIIYLMTKFNREDTRAFVVAVDMKNQVLQAVCPFPGGRFSPFIIFAYVHSRISNYLPKAKGTNENLELPRIVLPGSSSESMDKKHPGTEGESSYPDGDDMVLE